MFDERIVKAIDRTEVDVFHKPFASPKGNRDPTGEFFARGSSRPGVQTSATVVTAKGELIHGGYLLFLEIMGRIIC